MKSMTCKELGGACDKVFQGDSFEELVEQSKMHGREMFEKGDQAHLEAMKRMRELMQSAEAMQAWFLNKKDVFDTLPDK